MYKETVKNTPEFIREYLNEMDDSQKVAAHNQYCQNTGSSDDEIYENDEEFFENNFSGRIMDAIRAVSFGEYRYNDSYIKFNGYANLETFNDPSNEIDIDAIADDMQENPADYDIDLLDVFFLDDNKTFYEGTEDEAREQWEEYTSDLDEEDEKLTFSDWVKENLTEAD